MNVNPVLAAISASALIAGIAIPFLWQRRMRRKTPLGACQAPPVRDGKPLSPREAFVLREIEKRLQGDRGREPRYDRRQS